MSCEKNVNGPTREQWIIAVTLSGSINATNSLFCSRDGEQEEVNKDPGCIDAIATELTKHSSRMAIEDTITILNAALTKF